MTCDRDPVTSHDSTPPFGLQGVASLLTLKGRSKVMISTNLQTPPSHMIKPSPYGRWPRIFSDIYIFPHMEGALGISWEMTIRFQTSPSSKLDLTVYVPNRIKYPENI